MKRYTATHMIRMEHLNHHRTLYAGQAAEWMMEASFIAASLAHGNKDGLVFKNIHSFNFTEPIPPGDIITYESCVVRAGRSSITMHISLTDEVTGILCAEAYTTFVTVNPQTLKTEPHGIVLDETTDPDELRWREVANGFFKK